MLQELAKMEPWQIRNHVKAAQKLLRLLESEAPTTQRRKVGGPFRINQIVWNKDTGYRATILRFSGNGFVVLRSHYNGQVYSKHYHWLEAV